MNTRALSIVNTDLARKISLAITPALKTTLVVFLLFFPLTFISMFFHEAGHALAILSAGFPVHFLYAHPFSFVGFVRPMGDYYSIWEHASGVIVELVVLFVIFILLWKHRSIYTLPFLMLFPWAAVFNGIGGVFDIMGNSGDYFNILQITGWPATGFYIISLLLTVVGIFFFISLLPLMGLARDDITSLFVLPMGMILYAAPGSMIARYFVPGSPIDLRYHVAQEVIASAQYRPIFMGLTGILLAAVFLTLYRWVYRKLPSGLRTEKVNLSWKSLWYPGLLFVVSIFLGLIIIH